MISKAILESHPVSVLKKEIRKSNIKGYSGKKKAEIIEIMLKDENKGRFDHIEMAKKKEKLPSTKKQVEFLEALEEEDRKKAAKLPERKGKKKAVKVTTFGPTKPPRGKKKLTVTKADGTVIPLKKKEKKAKGTHKMPDGTVMSGKEHSPDSKPVKEKKRKPRKPTTKGRISAEDKLEKAYEKAMAKTPFDKDTHEKKLNEGYAALKKKYKK